MASSATATIEEHITCGICLEIYTNPHALKCLHTYCFDCIQALKCGQTIQCPDCRKSADIKHIKQEFKIQSMIDFHRNVQISSIEKSKTSPVKICEVCNVLLKGVKSFCSNCEEFMCEDCERAHKGSKATKTHRLISFVDMWKSKKQELEKKIRKLEHEKDMLVTTCATNKKTKNDIRATEIEQISEISKRREIIKQVDLHYNMVVEKVKKFNNQKCEGLDKQETLMHECEKDLDNKICFLYDILEWQNIEILNNTLEHLDDMTEEILRNSRSHVVNNEGWVKSSIEVDLGQNPEDSIKVKVTSKINGSDKPITMVEMVSHGRWTTMSDGQQEQLETLPVEQPQNKNNVMEAEDTKIIHTRYKQVERHKIDVLPHKLCLFKEKIWCAAGEFGIIVYDSKCEQVNVIWDNLLKDITGIANTVNGEMIASDSLSGLILLDHSGTLLCYIDEEGASDVSVCGDTMYALQYENIYMYKYISGAWSKNTAFQLPYYDTSLSDSLVATNDHICVCSHTNESIYILDSGSGKFLFKTGVPGGEKPGELRCPYLCDADREGTILVCDYGNNRLQTFNVKVQQWEKLMEPQRPVSAVIGDNIIWVGTQPSNVSNKLLKYAYVA